jgi:predicted enzyme related to lactoylglutathione lyase
MPIFKEPASGRFGWVELQTKDPAAAKKFYGELFGWKFQDMPSPDPNMTYAMATVGDASVAGVTSWSPEAAKSGAPPAWVSYVNVKDVQATVDAATKLGGKVVVPPSSMGPGTFAALQDPTGGAFLLWYSPTPMGDFLFGEAGALTWNELMSTNVDVAQRFYTQLFGWKAEAMPMPNMVYTVFKQGDAPIGGLMPQPPDIKGAPSAWFVYFAVDDADATWAKATKLGAKVLLPLTEVPTVGRFGWLQDPQGATFAIIKNASV